jgi:hypothetical protein
MAVTKIEPWEEFHPAAAFRHAFLSGIEITQNQAPVLTDSVSVDPMIYQTFSLPLDYIRGTVGENEGGEIQIPDITGVQVCFKVDDPDTFLANIAFGYSEFGDWKALVQGSVRKTHAAGDFIWVDAYFNKPITLSNEQVKYHFYVGVQSEDHAWVSKPAPIKDGKLLGSDLLAIPDDRTELEGSLMFRLLTASADEGVDFLGDTYRHVVSRNAVDRVSTIGNDKANGFWMSKPNPSKFAVESLFFDVRNENHDASVVDRMLIDPITPGVYLHLYYTSEGEPGTNVGAWNNKLWQPVFYDFRLDRRQEFALPEPITCKYLKVEFSHLQPQFYSAGSFSQPILYQKHPKWVLDYFMKKLMDQIRVTEDPFVSRAVRVLYDSLQLGYDYQMDDLTHAPYPPQSLQEAPQTSLTSYLSERGDMSDQLTPEMLLAINTELNRFQGDMTGRINGASTLLAQFSQLTALEYPTEGALIRPRADTTSVSTPDRMGLIIEQDYPVMLFYLKCRHAYREVEARFEQDKAYFVGVRELAFTREHYNVASDTNTYIENLGDFQNVLRNDFITEQFDPFEKNDGDLLPIDPDTGEPVPPPGPPPKFLVAVSGNIITVPGRR